MVSEPPSGFTVALSVAWFGSQTEIHLLFGGVHLGDLHLQLVAEADDAARAAADELIALFVVDIKIILHGGQRHETAHGQARHVHKEAEVPQIRHQGRISLQIPGSDLRAEEGEQFDVFTIAFGIGGIAFRARDMISDFLERFSVLPFLHA